MSVHLPRTTRDKPGLVKARRTAILNGNLISVVHQYLWDVAEMIEGCQAENVDIINWNEQNHRVVRFNRMLSSICRHDKDFQWDTFNFSSVEEILTKKNTHDIWVDVLTPCQTMNEMNMKDLKTKHKRNYSAKK
jgi:hypothetical protein